MDTHSATQDQYAIGLDFGQTATKGGIVSAEGRLIYTLQVESKLYTQPQAALDTLTAAISDLLHQAARQSITISGIGLSSTIDVNARTGYFRYLNTAEVQHWAGISPSVLLQNAFGIPAIVENDGIAAAWGEYRAGAGCGYQSVLSLTLGTGIGGGIILEGERLPDTVGAAAYFGHMSIDPNGPKCPLCPQRGCWELYAAGAALEQRARQAVAESTRSTLLGPAPTGREIVEAARAGDTLAIGLLNDTAFYLGFGLANLLNLFNPEAVIIGGGLAQAGDLLLEPARNVMDTLRMPLRERVDVKLAKLGAYSGVVGAALLSLGDT